MYAWAHKPHTNPELACSVFCPQAELHLLVSREEAPEVFDMEQDDSVEVGPFRGAGLDLRGSGILAVYQYPTVSVGRGGGCGGRGRAGYSGNGRALYISDPMRRSCAPHRCSCLNANLSTYCLPQLLTNFSLPSICTLVHLQLVMFVSGQGVASALALLRCSPDVPNLSPKLRTDIRIYFKVRARLMYQKC